MCIGKLFGFVVVVVVVVVFTFFMLFRPFCRAFLILIEYIVVISSQI